MTRTKKILIGLTGTLAVLLVAAVIVIQSQWFQNYVRDKVMAAVEESTGGRVEIGAFHFDLWHLTVKISNFILHGTEAPGVDPLARIGLLELRLKLLAGLKKTVDLAYLGVDNPKVNLIVIPTAPPTFLLRKLRKTPARHRTGSRCRSRHWRISNQ